MKTIRCRFALLALALLTVPAAAGAQEADKAPSEALLTAKGRISYLLFCTSCHGLAAKGDGSVAQYLKIPPADLTRIAARNDGEFPAEAVYRTIDGRKEVKGHGNRDMPVWGNAFKLTEETEDDQVIKRKISELVYYLKSIQEPAE